MRQLKLIPFGLFLALVWALGCTGDTRNGDYASVFSADGNAILVTFPHTQGWSDPEAHGRTALVAGPKLAPERCKGCHRLESVNTDGPPGCQVCHRFYPHPTGWGDSGVHVQNISTGFDTLKAAIAANCATACHGKDLNGGLSTVSCDGCHAAQNPPVSTTGLW